MPDITGDMAAYGTSDICVKKEKKKKNPQLKLSKVRIFTLILNLFNEGDALSRAVQRKRQNTRLFSFNSNCLRFLNLGSLGKQVSF